MTTVTAERAAMAAKFPREMQKIFAMDLDVARRMFLPDVELRLVKSGETARFIVQYHPEPIAELLPERTVNVEVAIEKSFWTEEGHATRTTQLKDFAFSSYGETKMVLELPLRTFVPVSVTANPEGPKHIRESNEDNNTLRYPENWP